MSEQWRIEMLGGLQVLSLYSQSPRPLVKFARRKSAALFAYLSFYARQSHTRERLADVLWPDAAPGVARQKLRVALNSLRDALYESNAANSDVLLADGSGIRLNLELCQIDVEEFEAALKMASGAPTAEARVRCLCEAVDLYHGELLHGWDESWVAPEVRRLEELFFNAIRQLLRMLEAAGEPGRALHYACYGLKVGPLREESHYELIRLHIRQGQNDAALLQFRRLEETLRHHFQRSPEEKTCQLVAALRTPGKSGHPDKKRRSDTSPQHSRQGHPKTSVETMNNHMVDGHTPAIGALPGLTAPPVPLTGSEGWLGGAITFLLLDNLSRDHSDGKGATLCRAELRDLIARHGGRETGALRPDSLWALFRSASDALSCALAMRRAALATPRMKACCGAMRIALDTGNSSSWGFSSRDNHLFEYNEAAIERASLERALEVLAAAHPEQTLCSEVTGVLLRRDLEIGVTLDDLGVFRLREAATPERLYQVSYPGMPRRSFPAPQAPPLHSGQLPVRTTGFFGREKELAQLSVWLKPSSDVRKAAFSRQEIPASHYRLVTLTGFGGCGKTRLAIESADMLRAAYAGAVWFVPLANVREPSLIADAIREALHLPSAPGLTPWHQVIAALGQKPLLLVLDNFEQLCEGGVAVVRRLLAEAPGVALLITSRRRLGLKGEHELYVRPLPLPPEAASEARSALDNKRFLSQVTRNPGVQIFHDRACAAHSQFQVTSRNAEDVAQLCRVLEGVPLALELAAAHVRTLTPAQMLSLLEARPGLERLKFLQSPDDDTPERHHTLRAAIEWSYELLDPVLRAAFTRLSVFRGGWSLAAAAAVACEECLQPGKDDESESLALDYIMRLQDASLVQAEEQFVEMRFSMLEMLRQFGAEQLTQEQHKANSARHAAYFAALAEAASPHLMDAGREQWLERLDPEVDNLRAALDWFLEHEPARCLQMAGALWRFWEARGYFSEGRQWLERALAGVHEGTKPEFGDLHPAEPGQSDHEKLPLPMPLYLRALNGAARLAWYRADFKAARLYLGESLSLARALAEASGDEASDANNQLSIANALHSLGLVAMCQGDASALAMLEEGLALVGRQGQPRVVKDFILGLALVRFYLGVPGTRELLYRALSISRDLGDQRGIAFALNNLGMVEGIDKNYGLAREYHEQALPLLRAMGDRWSTARALAGLGRIAWFENDIPSAHSYYTENLKILRDLGSRWELVYTFEGFAWLALRNDNPQRAARLLGAAETLREATGHVLFPIARSCYEECLGQTRQALAASCDQASAAAAWRTGRALSREEAIVEALKK